jgi:hypothetical protein
VNTGTKFVWQADPDEQVIWALASEHHKDIPRTMMCRLLPSFMAFLLTARYFLLTELRGAHILSGPEAGCPRA